MPDKEQVHAFIKHMEAKYKTTIVHGLGEVRDIVNLLIGCDDVLLPHEFAVTIGDRIFTSFNIYETTPEKALKTVCHEFTHAIQIARVGPKEFYSNYVLDPNQRAMYETEAHAAGFETMILARVPVTESYLRYKAHQIATVYRMPEQEAIIYQAFKRNLLHEGFSKTVQDWLKFNDPRLTEVLNDN